MSARIVQGSVEYLVVELRDLQKELSSLDGLGLKYDIVKPDGSYAVQNELGSNVGLQAKCLVDTTTGTWPVGRYKLFVGFDFEPEHPVLGPFYFYVDHAT